MVKNSDVMKRQGKEDKKDQIGDDGGDDRRRDDEPYARNGLKRQSRVAGAADGSGSDSCNSREGGRRDYTGPS